MGTIAWPAILLCCVSQIAAHESEGGTQALKHQMKFQMKFQFSQSQAPTSTDTHCLAQ